MLAVPAPASAGWGAPFHIAGPTVLDVIPARIAVSAAGEAAVSFGFRDLDHRQNSSVFVRLVSAAGGVAGVRRVPAAMQILDQTFSGSTLSLLTGASPRGSPCCFAAYSIGLESRGTFGDSQTLVGGLSGMVTGRLLPLPGQRQLAVVASAQGLWASALSGRRSSAPSHRLTPAGVAPQSLGATSLPGGRTVVAWTESPARAIFVASGTEGQLPRGRRIAVRLPAGHRTDELALVGRGATPSLAWIESWIDARGAFHSQVTAADLDRGHQARAISSSTALAAGLALVADARGDELVAWKECSPAGVPCAVHASARSPQGRFGAAVRLGRIDATEAPQPALARSGEALLGWVSGGAVLAADRGRARGRFGSPQVVASTVFASDLTLGFGPAKRAIAAWTQGTLRPSVVAALYRGR